MTSEIRQRLTNSQLVQPWVLESAKNGHTDIVAFLFRKMLAEFLENGGDLNTLNFSIREESLGFPEQNPRLHLRLDGYA